MKLEMIGLIGIIQIDGFSRKFGVIVITFLKIIFDGRN